VEQGERGNEKPARQAPRNTENGHGDRGIASINALVRLVFRPDGYFLCAQHDIHLAGGFAVGVTVKEPGQVFFQFFKGQLGPRTEAGHGLIVGLDRHGSEEAGMVLPKERRVTEGWHGHSSTAAAAVNSGGSIRPASRSLTKSWWAAGALEFVLGSSREE